jgi:hypothetical protein
MVFFIDRIRAKKKLNQTRQINRINAVSQRNSRRESTCDCDDNFAEGVVTGVIISNLHDNDSYDSDDSDYGDD